MVPLPKSSLFFFTIIFIWFLFFQTVLGKSNGERPGKPFYQHFELLLQNAQGVNPASGIDKFTIHGLWPSNETNALEVRDCTPDGRKTPMWPQSSFEPAAELNLGLQGLLNDDWPNILNPGQNHQFWKEEYDHHGTCCTRDFPTPQGYFSLAQTLYSSINFNEKLKGANMFPNGLLNKNDFISFIKTKITNNCEPRLKCKLDQGVYNNLVEVAICYDNKGVQFHDCPPLPAHNPPCDSTIFYAGIPS